MGSLNRERTLRWGFFGAGKITSDFVTILGTFPKTKHIAYGVAARDENRAKVFAKDHNIQKAFRSYQELAEDPEVDVIYIGTVNSEHYLQAKLAMKNKKHVLIEKPICANLKQCTDLIDTAKKERVFLMEGFWTTGFPATKKLYSEVKNGAVGDVVLVTLEVGRGGGFNKLDRFRLKELCGGVLLNHGVYGLMLTYLLLGPPDAITATGYLSDEGIDETATITLSYNDRACMSNVIISSRSTLGSEFRIMGTEGTAKLLYPFWAPFKCELPNETFSYEHPDCGGMINRKFHYPHATGLSYEIDEVYRCINEGLQESPLVPWEASKGVMKMADEVRKQIGVKFSEDEA